MKITWLLLIRNFCFYFMLASIIALSACKKSAKSSIPNPSDISDVLSNQIVQVNLQAKRQVFYGAGGSFGLYQDQWLSMTQANRDTAAKWLAKDINLKYAKTYIIDIPERESNRYDSFVKQVADLRKFNNDIKTQITIANYPDHLEIKDASGVAVKGEYNPAIVGIYDSVAVYYFHVLEAFKKRGMSIDEIDLLNEANFIHGNDPVYSGQLFAQCVPKLRVMLNNSTINKLNIAMPKIVGPSCLSTSSTKAWLIKWKAQLPAAFANTDIISTHAYYEGWSSTLYSDIKDLSEGKVFMNNEQTAKVEKIDPMLAYFDPNNTPAYVDDVSMAGRITASMNGGVNYFFAFLFNNPFGSNAALLKTPLNGAPSKSTMYHGFKQLTSLQPEGSTVLDRQLTQSTENGMVACLRKGTENKVYVHYTNITIIPQTFSIVINDNGKKATITSAKAWVSDQYKDNELTLNKTFDSQGVTYFNFTASPISVNSFEIIFK